MFKARFYPSARAAALALIACCASTGAYAELGGAMPAQAASRTILNGALRVRTMTDAGNTTLNEYATSTGQIVAYTWQGPTMPDLHALLGQYAGSYQAGAAAASANGNLHASRIARPDVIVESGGPMRSYVGRAWLPAALPAGVTADDLQ
ncbi:DUF2844 domain-containing protein [Paraburkholderia sp. Ac-20336]|uniref:DUF2844 domain-containing protein n=1 Tax=Burkholderiaceae TaxID=119060 RepID=UPI0014229700|nr:MULTISPECIES: DUF2844 domain-containing protein [Burkholderiaceae]MBN3803138.1 DUF2844 domain-containing protein [Paraburkholderia sp. Ac-20336]MBN3846888.1 DUF2844 domain-containing protein [Paraburkholderia sp. Ac-20342]NIF53811.1 DUF2844 domain-containing protein [Burkholderia sp. Ax-1724]NIF77621.1 DUF2844 domain-containing protein [Paraburkholderia sp. Cy-641]